MSYIESIKHFFNFNHGWLVFSCMDYGNLFECSDYTMGMIHTSNQTNQFYLSMLEIADERIDLELSYQAYKYHADIAKKLLEVYLRIIEYINHFPDQPIFRIVNELRESII